jgi:hypothetical protein
MDLESATPTPTVRTNELRERDWESSVNIFLIHKRRPQTLTPLFLLPLPQKEW